MTVILLHHRKERPLTVTDDPDLYDGAHVGVQIVGRRLQEEKVLALAKIVHEALSSSGGDA